MALLAWQPSVDHIHSANSVGAIGEKRPAAGAWVLEVSDFKASTSKATQDSEAL